MPLLQAIIEELERLGVVGIGVRLLLVVLATIIALRFASLTITAGVGRLFEREVREGTAQDVSAIEVQRRRDTLDGLLNRSLRVIILIIAFLMVLGILELDIGPAIAGLGIVGLALSLGAQHLVRDYVAGAFVLIENQYSKGDVVTIAGVTGTVEDISLRRTTLRDVDGTVHHVPHGLIQVSANLTRSWARINLDVPVLYGHDLGELRQVIDGAGRQLADDPDWKARVLEAPRLVGIENLGDQGMMLKVMGTVRAVDRWPAAGEMRRLIMDAFQREGLTLGWRMPPPPSPAPAETAPSGRKS
ncbi:MAG: mechanosensitive ion channel family protein [Chloroflexota bacterium]|nr:mechanosensitive ion channel family protein [Chloroflexota bacterium]